MPSPHTRPQTRADELYRTLRAAHSPLAAALMAAAVTRRWPAEFVSATAVHTR
ncbi:hypothetical protein ACWELJ_00410 [Nocardia sp. NPDC004582]